VTPTALVLFLLAQAPSPKQTFDNAAAALARQDYAAAEAGFQEVLKTQPGHIGALGNLGVVYSRQERFEEATAVYRRALKLAPTDAGLLLNLGLALLKQNRYKEARPPLDQFVRLQQGHRQGTELLATAQLYTGETAAAVSALERLDQTPGVLFLLSLAYLKQGDRPAAARAFESLESSLPKEQAAYLRGKAFYESGLFDEAQRDLEPAAEMLLDARRELGKVYVSIRKQQEAETQFRDVLRRKAGDRESAYFLGALLVERGEFTEGEQLLRAADPGFWGTHYYLGKSALKQQRTTDATRSLKRADELQPDDPNVLYQLLRAHQAAGEGSQAAKVAGRLKNVREKQRQGEQAGLVLR